ncbi:MAG: site-specific DNA-methyltransferase [Clostridia bacterium]|nr:site-specific DNA-methyltransferase [Clostridia bacterium]
MSTNVSKQKREDLLTKIKAIRTYIATAPQDENTANLLAYLSELEKDVGAKKYGLVFEEHREEIDEVLSTHTPVLTEDGSLFIDNGGQMNFLIEGDNLASLQLLTKTHKGKIDLICIDPPYNRGKKDFKYDDNYIELSDTFRHSKWLSFMDKRLRLMYSLLSPSGVIIINIDEHELAALSSLCQAIFTDDNVDYMIWQKTDSKVDRNTNAKIIHRFKSVHENIVVCYKNKANTFFNKMMRLPEWKNKQSNPDNDPRGPWSSGIISFEEGHKNEDKNSPNYYTITTPSGKQYTRHWFVDKEEFTRLQKDNRIAFPKGGDGVPRLKTFENEEKEYYMDSILRGVGTSSSAKDELFDIFGDRDIFDTPKPIKLIQELIRVSTAKTSIILDVFAGSGTTGHAVMKLNAEDGGNRRFILCTNNENNICREVTYERIKRVIDKEGYAASLKYFKVDYIPVSERMYYEYADELLAHIRELVELENGINFTGNAEVGIVLTDDELVEFIENGENFVKCNNLYVGHDVLMDAEQVQLLKDRKISIHVIPDYYYKELEG